MSDCDLGSVRTIEYWQDNGRRRKFGCRVSRASEQQSQLLLRGGGPCIGDDHSSTNSTISSTPFLSILFAFTSWAIWEFSIIAFEWEKSPGEFEGIVHNKNVSPRMFFAVPNVISWNWMLHNRNKQQRFNVSHSAHTYTYTHKYNKMVFNESFFARYGTSSGVALISGTACTSRTRLTFEWKGGNKIKKSTLLSNFLVYSRANWM